VLTVYDLFASQCRRRRRFRTVSLLVVFAITGVVSGSSAAGLVPRFPKLDADLENRAVAASSIKKSTVIVSVAAGAALPAEFKKYARARALDSINAYVLDLPDNLLATVSKHVAVAHVHGEKLVYSQNFRTAITSGAFFARYNMGFTGAGVGVAIVDSGTDGNHPDLNVAEFLDFVGTGSSLVAYDDAGHGTHIAGTLAGNGHDSNGKLAGMAPGIRLVSLKALDAQGAGKLSDVLQALDWLVKNAVSHKIRVVNLSFGTRVTESYLTDPLTLATRKLVEQGVVVVVAAGNRGTDIHGHKIYGGVTSPGNAPWVITVGASSTMGTLKRQDDEVANFSSRGPTAINFALKPDIVASGVGTVSTAANPSTEYTRCGFLTPSCQVGSSYMALTGTSMAAPVVSGTVALMLQANPSLTPNLVKAILEYTAEKKSVYNPLEDGAGFLNALGAVRLAQFYKTAGKGSRVPVEPIWSQEFFWGNYRITGGIMMPGSNAWANNIVWGSAHAGKENIVWGTSCGHTQCPQNIVWGTDGKENIVWGTEDGRENIVWGTEEGRENIVWGTDDGSENIVWGTDDGLENIVWGTTCGGHDCDNTIWGFDDGSENIVWGTDDGLENIVWGTDDGLENIVWGTDDGKENIVWGTDEGSANIVWGTDGIENIVWGTGDGSGNIVWGTVGSQNIVWGTVLGRGHDNIVWGTVGDENIVWGTALRRRRGMPRLAPNSPNLPYQWFLDPAHDAQWIRHEFGDTFVKRPTWRR
jgi:serine protease AprX